MKSDLRIAERQDRRFGRAMRFGLLASLVLHVLIFLWFTQERLPPSTLSAAGPDADDDEAAAGGAVQTVRLRIAEPQPIPRPPEPVFVPDLDVIVEPQPDVIVEQVDIAALTPGTGEPAETPGRGDSRGRGDAGNADAGRQRNTMPNPRGMFLPPTDIPRAARGRTFTVYLFIDARGRVVGDSTRVTPSSGSRSWDRELIERANEWVFEPARREGRPVAAWWQWDFEGT